MDILIRPIITEKATAASEDSNCYAFEVDKKATKDQVKQSVEKLFRVKVSKVPLLGDIPWLGALFRSTENKREKRNLLIFLRPTILRDKMKTREITEEKFNALWELNLGIKEDRGRIRERSEGEIIPRPAVEALFEGNPLNETVQDDEPDAKA